MAPETGTALLLLVAFVLPGFVALLIAERTHLVPVSRTPFELLLLATYYSVLCWGLIALAAWPLHLTRSDMRRIYREENLSEVAALGLVAVLVVPAVVATAGRLWQRSTRLRPWLLRTLHINAGHQTPTAWDELFGRRRPAMVRAVLSDRRVVGGYYGSRSFPGYGQQSQDLLLEQRWVLDEDNWFVGPAPGSHGLWLSAGTVVSLEMYDPIYDEPSETAPTTPDRPRASGSTGSPDKATAEAL
jgi:Family of unknown function (DUF6338)